MASAPSGIDPVHGRVDRQGRLTEAGPALLRLQEEAGSRLGAPIAIPQLAAVIRSAMKLGVPLSRSVIAASADQDLDLWVRVEPDADGAALAIEGWKARAPAPPRLTLVASQSSPADDGSDRANSLTTDAELQIVEINDGLVARLGKDASSLIGRPLTRLFQLVEDGEGVMPLLSAIGSRQDFAQQLARVRGGADDQQVILDGTANSAGGKFAGYEIRVTIAGDGGEPAGMFDPVLDEALRSPLDHIIAAADRIVDRSEGPLRSDYAAYAGDIAAAGRHLLSVIRAMTEQETGNGADLDVPVIAAEAIQLVQPRAQERGISIEFIGAPEGALASGEERGVVQILVNLLGNAVRHSPDGAVVSLSIERRGDMLAVTIADSGPGIAMTDQQRIFERYERVGNEPGGIGLGLAISRRLARSMGGDIELESAPGEGARFTLVLPAA